MIIPTPKRIVIIGNGGAGKSYLARALGDKLNLPAVHLDSIFWMPGGFSVKRAPKAVDQLIAEHRSKSEWIVEGVFGELAAKFLDRAELLIWLDLPWEVCRDSLLLRGSESSKQLDPIQAEENFKALLIWCSEYWTRTSPRSHCGHEKLFHEFVGEKVRLLNRSEFDAFLVSTHKT